VQCYCYQVVSVLLLLLLLLLLLEVTVIVLATHGQCKCDLPLVQQSCLKQMVTVLTAVQSVTAAVAHVCCCNQLGSVSSLCDSSQQKCAVAGAAEQQQTAAVAMMQCAHSRDLACASELSTVWQQCRQQSCRRLCTTVTAAAAAAAATVQESATAVSCVHCWSAITGQNAEQMRSLADPVQSLQHSTAV
jgi:hypothetical protein